MSATELAAVVVTIASVVAAVVLVFGLIAVHRALQDLRSAVEELGDTVRSANVEIERLGGVLGTAESIGGTVDSASRLAYLAMSNPVIKVMAVATGTGRAARRFRRIRSQR